MMCTMGTLQYWICVFVSLWNVNMCNMDIPNRRAMDMITTNDPVLLSNNGTLCQNETVPTGISFQRLTVNDNILYIGATNRILQINLPVFEIDQVAVQGPIDDNPVCVGPHICPDVTSCSLLECVDNRNRLLLPHREQLIVCGSADFGTCDILPLKNISKTFMPRPSPANAMKCTGAKISQIAKAGGPMTVASVFNSEQSTLKDIFYLGSREKEPFMVDILYPPRTTRDGSKLKFLRISKSAHFEVNEKKDFLLSWTTPSYGFMLWSTDGWVTKLARLCHAPLNDNPDQTTEGQFSKTSYTEISITCGDHTKAALAYQVNEILYLFMLNKEGEYALCSTTFSSINSHFLEVRTDCLNGTLSVSKPSKEDRVCQVKKNVEGIAKCGFPQSASVHAKAISSVEGFTFDINMRYLWPTGQSAPTTFAVDQLGDWEVGFFGTPNGTVLKTDIGQLRGQFVESITLGANVPVLHDVGFDESRSHFYAMSSDAVYQIKVSSCEQYDDCGGCVGSRDPYCGWCVLQSRCTAKNACADSADTDRWMDISRDPVECPRVIAVKPSTLSITTTEKLSLTFGGNMVEGINYTCSFNVNGISIGRSPLNNFPTSPTCQSPQNPPAVREGQDYMDITLEIEANRAVVAKGKFNIYDCSRTPLLNTQTMCASCVTSRWNCTWCSTSTSCSDNCTDGVSLKDEEICPSVVEIIDSSNDIPVGRDHEFMLKVRNFTASNYDCVVTVCDGEAKVTAPAVLDGDIVTCSVDGDSLHCNKEDSIVSVNLQSGSHIVDSDNTSLAQVNLFNCSGSKAECGICVLTSQRHPECSWCANEKVCTEDCSDGGFTDIASCPTARIDQILPLNGPIDGGTEITITGTNLATSLEQISGLFVKNNTSGINVNCSVVPQKYVPSKRIVCVTASTTKPIQGQVHIAVSYASDDVVSTEEFEFKDVLARDYNPKYALKGTELTIDGKNLDVGNNANIRIDGLLGGSLRKNCPDRTSNRIRCMAPGVTKPGRYDMTVALDGYQVLMDGKLEFLEEPNIQGLIGRKSLTSFGSGGIQAEFEFSSLLGIQSVVLSVNNDTREECQLFSDRSSVICPIPSLEAAESQTLRRSKRQDSVQSNPSGVARKNISSKLLVNGVTEIPLDDKFQLSYVDDPIIYDLRLIPCYNPDSTGNGVGTSTNESMVSVHLSGKHLADAAVAEDYTIVITGLEEGSTSIKCDPSSISTELLSCRSSVEKMREYEKKKVRISIKAGNFSRTLESEYCQGGASGAGFSTAVIGAIIAVVVVLILIIVILICIQRHRAQKQQKEREQIMKMLDKLENKTRENARKAYFELQLGYMTTFTDNIGDSITYISPISCFMKALFNNWTSDHPMLANKQLENVPNIKLVGVDDFAVLLKNKEFLILLVKTLEEQKQFTVKEKGQFASLLTVCLFDDMVYYTRVMMELLSELIQKHVGKNPKLLLRRSESVVEKMVSHWLCINLYSECIRGQAGKPLFLMSKAIHFLVTSAPCDVVANKAVNSLNEMTLLGTEVTYEVMTLRASVMTEEKRSDVFEVKVVNCDTITQVKEKIIEVYYRDKPYSECPKPDKLQLELLVGGQGNVVLSDVDHMSHKEGSYTRINTLRHYGVNILGYFALYGYLSPDTKIIVQVPDGAEVTLCPATDDEQAAEAGSPPPEVKKKRLYHLVDPRDKELNGMAEEDDGGKGTKALIGKYINQPFREIFLTRMVKSKSTVQEYVDNVFNAILNPSPISRCVKYLFQFLDKEAIKHKITDAEVLHIWKNNSLLLRYWVNILKNPEFLFDVNKSAIVDSCLNVITQAFMDACTTTSHKLGQDSPSNKLLYAKDSAKYKEMVSKFFVSVSNEENVSDGEIIEILKDTSTKYAKDFNKQAAALELFNYVDKYRSQVLEAVENESLYSRLNETIRKISPDTNGHQTAYETSILV